MIELKFSFVILYLYSPKQKKTNNFFVLVMVDHVVHEWQECSFTPGWKIRKASTTLGYLVKFEFLSPDNRIVINASEVMDLLKNPPPFVETSKKDDNQAVETKDDANSSLLEMQNQKPESTMDMDWEKVIEEKLCIPDIPKLNQTFVTQEWKLLRKACIENYELSSCTFDQDVVVFVPKLTKLIQDEEMRARLDNGDKPGKISVPLNLIHSDEGYENNSADLKNLMTKRQKQEYRTSKKVADQRENSFVDDVQRMENEKKIDNVSEVSKVPEQRSLRFKQRQNYEEMNDEDFNSLLLKPKAVVVQHHVSNTEDEQKVQSVSGNQPSMRVRERNRMTDYETSLLEKWFNLNPYPTSEERDIIAEMMEMPEKKVRVWFQNKRYKTEDGRMKSMYAKNASISSTISSSERKASSVGPSIPSSSSDCQHPCKLCNQNFTSETDHKIHIKRVHGNDGEKVVCKECLKAFDTLWNLKTHQIEEHMSLGIFFSHNSKN